MIWTLVVVLVVLWALGNVFFASIGSLIHLLLVLAVIAAVYNLIVGRRGSAV